MKRLKGKREKKLFIILISTLATFSINIPTLIAGGSVKFKDVKIIEEDAKTKVYFITDKSVAKYTSFTLSNPPSIVIDIQNTQCEEKEIIVGRRGINKISITPHERVNTRGVISLVKLLPCQIQKVKDGIEVIIDNPYHEYQLTGINIKEDEFKISISILATAPPLYKYFDLSNPTRIIIDFLNATNKIGKVDVPTKIIKSITPIQRQIDPVNVARVMVELTEFLPYQVFSDGNRVTLELTKDLLEEVERVPPPPKPTPEVVPPKVKEVPPPVRVKEAPPVVKRVPAVPKVKKREEKVKEKPIIKKPVPIEPPPVPVVREIKPKKEEEPILSLDFKEADILDVLRVIGHKAKMNILPGKDVKGAVTVRLDNVPLFKALDLILKSLGYAYVIEDNIIRVDTPTVLLGETTTRVFKLNYAKASDMVGIVTNMLTTLAHQQARRMGGAPPVVGTVIADTRVNGLIVTDIPYNVNQIEEIIKKLDTMTPQVMIEAKIVEVTLDKRNMFGFTWSVEGDQPYFVLGSYHIEGAPMGDRGEFLYSKITSAHEINLHLQALIREGKANILSSPKILALDNETAEIIVGENIPYQKTTTGEKGTVHTSVEFMPVGVKLKVTPHINPDNFIMLEVKPEVSSLKEWAYGMPVISTKQATSKLVVKDGETVVIGGIIDDQGTEMVTKVPLLGDFPFIGKLFRKKLTETRKTELLIFITPYIKKYA